MSRADDRKAPLAYVRRVSLDTVRRTPTPAERRAFTGAPLATVAGRLQKGVEALRVWLEEELYYFLLLDNFRPRTESVASIPERLADGRLTVRDAVAEIMLSTGFSLRNPGNDTFVTVVLEQCLGLTVQDRKVKPVLEAGKQMYDGRKVMFLGARGSSQSDLIRIVLAQRAFAAHLLDRQWRRLFGAPLPGKELAATVDRVHERPGEFFDVLVEWLASERYFAALATKKPITDRQFVRSLYTDLLGRQPTYEEMRNMRNALQSMADPTPLRTVMVKLILDSGRAELPAFDHRDPAPFVARCFLQYLGREPTQAEQAKFTKIVTERHAPPALVVRALVGSAEYQYY